MFTGCYLPGFRGGGPIRTIANIVDRLGDDFEFFIVTSDRDLGDTFPYGSVRVNSWNVVGKAQVFYAAPSQQSIVSIVKLVRETSHDVLYLNSFFNVRFTLKPILARWLGLIERKPLILAPRGEFAQEALRLKRWKKSPFVKLTSKTGMFKAAIWQASTSLEKEDILRVTKASTCMVKVATNIAAASDPNAFFDDCFTKDVASKRIENVALQICFLSRIAPMKNLDYALNILIRVRSRVHFTVYGPKESADYWNICDDSIQKLPPNVEFSYGGIIENSQVRAVISQHDLFFVPSRGENFGHVFVEALSAGVPILVSDRTPWRGLQEKNIGWDIPLDQSEDFVAAIEAAADFDHEKRMAMKRSCINFANETINDDAALQANKDLFLIAAASSKK